MNIRPFVVEFTGTPEAGKTTSIKQMIPIIEEQLNCNVVLNQESAESLPSTFTKGGFADHIWMANKTISSLRSALANVTNDIIVTDRGIIDSLFFSYKLHKEKVFTEEEYSQCISLLSENAMYPNLCIILTSSPEESIRRRGGEGRLVTLNWLKSYNAILNQFMTKFQKKFTTTSFFTLDTTNLPQDTVVEIISKQIVEHYLERNI